MYLSLAKPAGSGQLVDPFLARKETSCAFEVGKAGSATGAEML